MVGRPFPVLALDLKTRFEMSYIPEPNSGCWLWEAGLDDKGYGRITISRTRKMHYAHRVAYLLYKGLPTKNVLHICDLPCCVNPEHLYDGTHKDNAEDRKKRNRSADQNGENGPRAKLTGAQVLAIRADKRFQKDIAKDYGITQVTVCNIKKRVSWKHV
jgi:hypothetical protein